MNGAKLRHCTFCRNSEKDVWILIAGYGVYICDQCVSVAHAILAEKRADDTSKVER